MDREARSMFVILIAILAGKVAHRFGLGLWLLAGLLVGGVVVRILVLRRSGANALR